MSSGTGLIGTSSAGRLDDNDRELTVSKEKL